MKKTIYLLCLALAAFLICSCSAEPAVVQEFPISGVSLPPSVSTEQGEVVTFNVYGKNAQEGDKIVLVTGSGREFTLPISTNEQGKIGFIIPEKFYTGYYTIYLEHNSQRTKIGTTQFNVFVELDVQLVEDENLYGIILWDGTPMKDVVVSDGITCVKTNEEGIYKMASTKKHGYVFVSTPSGYTFMRNGSSPIFYEYLIKDASEVERVDFTLVEDPGQENHTMIVMGDIHLANRNDDIEQFTAFVNDINQYMAARKGQKFYGITLGDLAWDQYWIDNNYNLTNYLADLSKLNNLAVYNTIGNHDHVQGAAGDFYTVEAYKEIVGPTYYSYNIGNVHYISLDNIECTNNGSGSRTYNTKIVQEELDWLVQDLSFVSETTPVVISMHAPLYNDAGENRLTNSDQMLAALGGRPVHILTGHTHLMYNNDKGTHYEHNTGAVCATWWWTGSQTEGIHLSQDGTPGGALLLTVNGTEFEWIYKPTGKTTDHQFRTYDRNEICLTTSRYVPEATSEGVATFKEIVGDYENVSTSNEVLINVWGYDPQWTVEVTENGQNLEVVHSGGKDPLHMISYPAKRLNAGKGVTFKTSFTKHMFKVTASSATSTLNIKVTDRFGNVYTEEMKRPKAFEVDTYK